ncbi:ATP-grasp domain-containing protein [Epibacterium sp. DP7N7-1]|nr:ATP-grasp domain-containing protein [Epibacterium sp. DP7N7-1]
MSALYYRLTDTQDPEERLEDACMWKAMHDTFGDGITLIPTASKAPADGVIFGRTKRFEDTRAFVGRQNIDYSRDPGFDWGISRKFETCDLSRAKELVEEIHNAGNDAFVKAVEQKLMTKKVSRGTSLDEAIGDLIWSFIDIPRSLMVQEFVEMRNERRFVVIGGEIVTQSAVAFHLTPLDRSRLAAETGQAVEDLHFTTPTCKTPHLDAMLSRKMENFVATVAQKSEMDNAIIDVAELTDGRIEVIEFNPCQPGMFGLFACDPHAIALASRHFLPEDLAHEVDRRKADKDPAPVPADGKSLHDIIVKENAPELEEDHYSDMLFDGP